MRPTHYRENVTNKPICSNWENGDIAIDRLVDVTCNKCKEMIPLGILAGDIQMVHLEITPNSTVCCSPYYINFAKNYSKDINEVTCMDCLSTTRK